MNKWLKKQKIQKEYKQVDLFCDIYIHLLFSSSFLVGGSRLEGRILCKILFVDCKTLMSQKCVGLFCFFLGGGGAGGYLYFQLKGMTLLHILSYLPVYHQPRNTYQSFIFTECFIFTYQLLQCIFFLCTVAAHNYVINETKSLCRRVCVCVCVCVCMLEREIYTENISMFTFVLKQSSLQNYSC